MSEHKIMYRGMEVPDLLDVRNHLDNEAAISWFAGVDAALDRDKTPILTEPNTNTEVWDAPDAGANPDSNLVWMVPDTGSNVYYRNSYGQINLSIQYPNRLDLIQSDKTLIGRTYINPALL